MDCCPICGKEITLLPHFDVREPTIRGCVILHKPEDMSCPASAFTPPVKYQAFNGDCLTGMGLIPDKSVDLILCDLPYGTTRNKWDMVIPFADLWKQYERIIKDNGAIVLFSDGLFTVQLIQSNTKLWRYNLVWDKGRGCDFLNANVKPLKCHEDIVVFYKRKPTYNKQVWYSTPYKPIRNGSLSDNYGERGEAVSVSENGERNPLTILSFGRDSKKLHPTQKPVALLEYLIKTYTNEGDTVLDNCFGSGSTLEAAVKCGRAVIGFEKEARYYETAAERLQEADTYVRERLDGKQPNNTRNTRCKELCTE